VFKAEKDNQKAPIKNWIFLKLSLTEKLDQYLSNQSFDKMTFDAIKKRLSSHQNYFYCCVILFTFDEMKQKIIIFISKITRA